MKTIDNCISSLVTEICRKIQFSGNATGCAVAFEDYDDTDNENHEIELRVKYRQSGGGASPDSDPYKLYIISIDMFIDYTQVDPNEYNITVSDFEYE
jgi:hypothetical protein